MCRYAAVFGAFVAGMACLVGIDFSAKLMASLALCFEVISPLLLLVVPYKILWPLIKKKLEKFTEKIMFFYPGWIPQGRHSFFAKSLSSAILFVHIWSLLKVNNFCWPGLLLCKIITARGEKNQGLQKHMSWHSDLGCWMTISFGKVKFLLIKL